MFGNGESHNYIGVHGRPKIISRKTIREPKEIDKTEKSKTVEHE